MNKNNNVAQIQLSFFWLGHTINLQSLFCPSGGGVPHAALLHSSDNAHALRALQGFLRFWPLRIISTKKKCINTPCFLVRSCSRVMTNPSKISSFPGPFKEKTPCFLHIQNIHRNPWKSKKNRVLPERASQFFFHTRCMLAWKKQNEDQTHHWPRWRRSDCHDSQTNRRDLMWLDVGFSWKNSSPNPRRMLFQTWYKPRWVLLFRPGKPTHFGRNCTNKFYVWEAKHDNFQLDAGNGVAQRAINLNASPLKVWIATL